MTVQLIMPAIFWLIKKKQTKIWPTKNQVSILLPLTHFLSCIAKGRFDDDDAWGEAADDVSYSLH